MLSHNDEDPNYMRNIHWVDEEKFSCVRILNNLSDQSTLDLTPRFI